MYEDWISKQEVIRRTGLTGKTVERKTRSGELTRHYLNIPGRRPLAVFPPQEIEQLEQKTLTAVPTKKRPLPALPPPSDPSLLLSLIRIVERKLYVTLKEAVLLSGLPPFYIIEQVRTGGLPAVKVGRAWRIRSDDLRQHRVVSQAVAITGAVDEIKKEA